MVIDEGIADIGERQAAQRGHRCVRRDRTRSDIVDQLAQSGFVHPHIVAASRPVPFVRVRSPPRSLGPMTRIGFLGPLGTFTEQALKSQPDLARAELVPYRTMPDVLDAVDAGEVDLGFVAIENSIEGAVNLTQDELAFNHDLLIQREVVLDIEHCLVAHPGTRLGDVTVVLSIPVATAQCHAYLRQHVPQADVRAANSTADGARLAAELGPGTAAVAPRVAGERYGLEVLATDIADHPGNQTRFVVVAKAGVPPRTGHDRTALVVYQRADEPGSLISILQEFAARRINLSNLISRPTKNTGLGNYCFILYADGHITDELLADAMKALHAKQGRVKFLGSYPAAGFAADEVREEADARSREADEWMTSLRHQVWTMEGGR